MWSALEKKKPDDERWICSVSLFLCCSVTQGFFRNLRYHGGICRIVSELQLLSTCLLSLFSICAHLGCSERGLRITRYK